MALRDIKKASLYAEDDAISEAWRDWAVQRHCVNCGTYYTTFNSFGMRQCGQHYKDVEVVREPNGQFGEEYPCCQKKIPRPNYIGPGSMVPCAQLLDQFMCTPCDTPIQAALPPIGCTKADCTDRREPWPIGFVQLDDPDKAFYEDPDVVRPVGGWKINNRVKIGNDVYEIRSPPNAFGEVRVQYIEGPESDEPKRTDVHLKDVTPHDFDVNGASTLEIMDPDTGRITDKISKITETRRTKSGEEVQVTYWRKWSAGVSIPDIAGMLPFMVNPQAYGKICGTPFPTRAGVNANIPIVWRINVPNKLLGIDD